MQDVNYSPSINNRSYNSIFIKIYSSISFLA